MASPVYLVMMVAVPLASVLFFVTLMHEGLPRRAPVAQAVPTRRSLRASVTTATRAHRICTHAYTRARAAWQRCSPRVSTAVLTAVMCCLRAVVSHGMSSIWSRRARSASSSPPNPFKPKAKPSKRRSGIPVCPLTATRHPLDRCTATAHSSHCSVYRATAGQERYRAITSAYVQPRVSPAMIACSSSVLTASPLRDGVRFVRCGVRLVCGV